MIYMLSPDASRTERLSRKFNCVCFYRKGRKNGLRLGESSSRRRAKAFVIWFLTVFTDMSMRSAISSLERPSRLLSRNISRHLSGRESIAFHSLASRSEVSTVSSSTSGMHSTPTVSFRLRINDMHPLRTLRYMYALKSSNSFPSSIICQARVKASSTMSSAHCASSTVRIAYMPNGRYILRKNMSNSRPVITDSNTDCLFLFAKLRHFPLSAKFRQTKDTCCKRQRAQQENAKVCYSV